MKAQTYSYRYAEEILQHKNYVAAWNEIMSVVKSAPVFRFPNKSAKNRKLDVVQQVMNTYFDRLFAVDLGWEYHPLATKIEASGLLADFRKTFTGSSSVFATILLSCSQPVSWMRKSRWRFRLMGQGQPQWPAGFSAHTDSRARLLASPRVKEGTPYD